MLLDNNIMKKFKQFPGYFIKCSISSVKVDYLQIIWL